MMKCLFENSFLSFFKNPYFRGNPSGEKEFLSRWRSDPSADGQNDNCISQIRLGCYTTVYINFYQIEQILLP